VCAHVARCACVYMYASCVYVCHCMSQGECVYEASDGAEYDGGKGKGLMIHVMYFAE
jgi:hypothetical protein